MSSHTPSSPAPAYEAKPTQLIEKHSTASSPAYEAKPVQLTEKNSTAPAVQVTGLYRRATGQQHSGTTHQDYLQNATAPMKNECYTSEQQPMQQQPMQQQYQQMYQTAVPLGALQDASAPVDCPVCRHRALTILEKVSGNTVHLWAALACFVLCLGCVPYLMPSLKDVKHKCGHCGVLLAEWHKSGRTVVLQHA